MPKVPDIKIEPPGPAAREIIAKDDSYVATTTKSLQIVAKRARGLDVEDVDGNMFLDFSSGISVLNVGHCHPRIVEAVKRQSGELMHFAGTDFYYDIQASLAQRLSEVTPGTYEKKTFFSNSGTESVEAAIKIARWSTRRSRMIAFIGAFHGRTMGSLSLTASKPVQQQRFFPGVPGVTHLPFAYCYRCPYHLEYPSCDLWCAKTLEETYFSTFVPPDEVAALFGEPVQGEGGYVVPPKEFYPTIHKIIKKHGILFADDEVQAGLGRTGRMWGIENWGIQPDIMSMSKSLGSGIPIAATVFRKELDFGVEGSHSNTFGGNLVGCAASLATLDVIKDERLVENSAKMGEYFRKRLAELQEKHEIIGDVRGLGLMIAVEFVRNRKTKEFAVKERDDIINGAFKRGLILLGCGKSGVRLIPSLNVTKEQIDTATEIIDSSISAVVD
ncbi:MAG: acetyl ornithine aminotransferase family protein [Candidatus Thermoplasmatota archaeon]|jgi:4-aminobutyrate aminotransferase|nr:acetyl ornithine aminotransferase family protein [Candidatus Sysuiplasma jiujiangense]MBX8638773.1 acetyl ornithine aminotransferase family protein [Candidatus Sysuiplasma jiujiangense]MBX8642299.1 acetyl ornithine aminotransferase family protein [Candidatus Sysuiplasma jiujiangense]MCL4318191.1 acetyl ornithine aminotransferase family protein [Candidatus Thermoplasmatota archaeon]MCL5253010.1 acetyl ornithine aminotransferase family protein [Candidatus Thermoplasmatota archaeon]